MAPGLGELLLLCRSRRVSRGAGCCFSLNGDSVLARGFLVGYLPTTVPAGSIEHLHLH